MKGKFTIEWTVHPITGGVIKCIFISFRDQIWGTELVKYIIFIQYIKLKYRGVYKSFIMLHKIK